MTTVVRGMNFAVLNAIAVLGPDASGVAIREYLERQTSADILSAHVYKALSRLEQQELVHCSENVQGRRGRGRPRLRYELLEAGTKALALGRQLYGVPEGFSNEAKSNEATIARPAKVS